MPLLPLGQTAQAGLKLGQIGRALRPEERGGLLQLRLERGLQLQP
jgi:hypothetical protein